MESVRLFKVGRESGELESFETLIAHPALRVVRIVSRGHVSPPGRWYDQDEHEWIALLAGEAELAVEGRGNVRLGAGDSLLLPARTRHRVERTAATEPTIWLAIFFGGGLAPSLPADAAARILGHMNADHADALLDYARALRGLTDVTAANMTAVDAAGFDLEAETPTGPRQLRFPFDPPVGDAKGAREALVAMARAARRPRDP